MTMPESSLEAELLRAQDEARQARAELLESARRVAELEGSAAAAQIRALENQIEELRVKLKEASPGSPKAQSDDEYIVVEQESPESPESLSFQLKEREAEIRKAIAHAKKLEEMYNAAEERTLSFERQVQVLEANVFEKFDDANALLEKVKELGELLTAGQTQIAALEEKSKTSDDAQKKVEYEKVLFLETEDQLVKNFQKAHAEAEEYRNMINLLEVSIMHAEEKAAHAEKCMEVASQRNQELEAEIANLSSQLQLRTRPELMELEAKAELLEQELQIFRDQKKIEDDVKSVDEKTVVHEATTTSSSSSHPPDNTTSSSFEDEMKFLGENVMAHMTQSKLLIAEIEKVQAEAFEAELRVQEFEGKMQDLKEELGASRQREERLKQDAKVMEEKASFFEGLKLSYADYTCDLEKKNSKLEEELVAVREEVDRMRDAEALVADLQRQVEASQVCEMCSQLRTHIQDLEALLGELSLDLQEAERKEKIAQKDLKEKTEQLAEKAAEHSDRVQELEGQLQGENLQAAEGSSRVKALEARVNQLQEENLSQATEYNSRIQALEAQLHKEKSQAASQAAEHVSLVQALEARVSEFHEENFSQATEHSSRVQALEARLQEVILRAASQATEHSSRVRALEAQLQEQKSQAASQATEQSSRIQALEARVSELLEENLSQGTEHGSRVQALEFRAGQLQEENLSQATEHSSRVQALEARVSELQEENSFQATEHSSQVEALQSRLQEQNLRAASQATEHSSRVQALEAQLLEQKLRAASQATEQSSRVQALDAQLSELREENLQAKASIAESRLWAQEAASLLREHVQSLRDLREGGGRAEVDEERGAFQAKVEGLHLEFLDVQLCDGTEALQICRKLSSLEKECLNSQMLETANKISKLEGELEVLKSEMHALQNPPEPPAVEVKRSFREVILEGEVQSMRAQLTEFHHLKAQASEIPSLQAQLAHLQLDLRAAEKREHAKNLALVKVQREVCAAEEKVCSLKDTLLNQTQVNELKEQVSRLEQNLMKSEESNTSLKEEIDSYVKSNKETTIDKATDLASNKVTDEITSESQKQADVILQEPPPKTKTRKRKIKKNGKAPVSLNSPTDMTHSFRHRTIAVFLVTVLLVAVVIRISLR